MTNEWLRERAAAEEESIQTKNIITERCSFAEHMNEKLREEIKLLNSEHERTCTLNSIAMEEALKFQKNHDENQCIKEIADNAKMISLTTQLDKINQLHEMKKKENKDLVCAIVTQLELFQSTIKLIKNDACDLRSTIKHLETKLSIIKTKCTKNNKSFSDTLTSISNENKTIFQKLKKMFDDLKSVTNASNLRAEEEIIKSMYLTRENTNMKLELFEFRRKAEKGY
jgi:hypothetical protein